MRGLLAIGGLLAILTAPYAEYDHGHATTSSHDDCPACHVKSNPADLADPPLCRVAPVFYEAALTILCVTTQPRVVSLRIAPKTSPPASLV